MLGLEASTTSKITTPRAAPGRSSLALLRYAIIALVSAAALAAVLTALVLEIQAGARAYVVGEGHWSKAQQDAVYHLYRYAEHGEVADLTRARAALAVPLADRDARFALESDPIDLDRARAGFIAGGNAPEDVGRMIALFRFLPNAPYMRESVTLWRQADESILELRQLADDLEALYRLGTPAAGKIRALQTEISQLDATLRPIELAYSKSLLQAARLLHNFLLVASAVIFVLIAGFAIVVLRGAVRRISESESKFRAAFDQAAVGMLKLDCAGEVIEANQALAEILGYEHAQLIGRSLASLLHRDEHDALLPRGVGADWRGQETPSERRFLRRDGSAVWGRWTASLIRGADRQPDRVFAIVEDVSKARQLAAEMAHQASHDALTGLINRREIERRLESALASAHVQGMRHTLCFIDLDQFKLINDTCGHAVGDLMLRQIAIGLSSQLDEGDWVGRLGGDEFALLLHGARLERAEVIAGRVRTQLAASIFPWQGRNFSTTCSIGLVEISAATSDVSWLLRAADAACYLAKDEGRNRVRSYRETDAAIARRRSEMEWVGEVSNAMAEGRLQLYAQRIVPMRGQGGLMYEVLLRLLGTDGRLHAPASFLHAAERYGQAAAIDRVVLRLLFDQLAADPAHLDQLDLCHVNVSAQSITDPSFRNFVVDRIERGRVPPSKICFEITETAVMANLGEARAFIDAVRARGCRVALDDFGSGLSSFGYLKHLDIDILKIDGMFVREIDSDNIDFALVRSICELGRTLGKSTIAEWAETDAVVSRLVDVGVDYVQGFALHIPCRLDELMRQVVREPERNYAATE